MDMHADPALRGMHTRRHPHPVGLTGIFTPDTQVAVWERQPDADIARYLADSAHQLGAGLRFSLAPGAPIDPSPFPDHSGRSQWLGDMAALVELYADLLGCPTVGARIEVMQRAMCPRLHVDRTGIRATCTYLGPATEWIDDDGVTRSRLGAGANGLPDEHSGLFAPHTRIESAAPFDLVLLKGSLWQGNAGRGAIHRSPEVPGGTAPRVMLVLDALW